MKKSSDQGMFPPDWDLIRRVEALADAAFDGIELNIGGGSDHGLLAENVQAAIEGDAPALGHGVLPVGSSSEDTAKIRSTVESKGLVVSAGRGGGTGTDLSSPDSAVRSKALETIDWYFGTVRDLGADAVLMVLGHVTQDVRHDQALDIARSVIKELLPIAERTGVHVCLEPVWPKFGGSFIEPVGLRDFIDEFDNEYLRAYFDVGNVLVWTFPQHWIRILGDRIYRVHIKDFRTDIGNIQGFTHLLHGDVPWADVMEAFRETSYDNWLTCELSPMRGDPDEGITQTSRAMDQILAM